MTRRRGAGITGIPRRRDRTQNRCIRCGPDDPPLPDDDLEKPPRHLVLATVRPDGTRAWTCGVAGCPCEADGCQVLRRVHPADLRRTDP